MTMPFYVSPEQLMKDRSDYARKGIARGKPVVVLEFAGGILFIADNPSTHLHKVSEIYDRIAFAAAGKYSEYENLRIAGVRLADIRGYSYGREDVTAKSLTNAYSQALSTVFTQEMKPYEVEILVAQVGEGDGDNNEMFHILFDGSVNDAENFMTMGGEAEALAAKLRERYQEGLDLPSALRLGVDTLKPEEGEGLDPGHLEVAALDRTRQRRKFVRLTNEQVAAHLSG